MESSSVETSQDCRTTEKYLPPKHLRWTVWGCRGRRVGTKERKRRSLPGFSWGTTSLTGHVLWEGEREEGPLGWTLLRVPQVWLLLDSFTCGSVSSDERIRKLQVVLSRHYSDPGPTTNFPSNERERRQYYPENFARWRRLQLTPLKINDLLVGKEDLKF